MVDFYFKRSDREIRERMNDAPKRWQGTAGVTRYARDPEEARELVAREHGLDNPNHPTILCDDGGKAEKYMQDKAARIAGVETDD